MVPKETSIRMKKVIESSTNMNVLMVCHVGSGSGLGHLTRSLVVAKALKDQFDASVQFLIQGELIVKNDLENFDNQFVSLEQSVSLSIQAINEINKLDIVIFDLYPGYIPRDMKALLVNLRTSGSKIVAIDGLLEYRSELDMIFIPSFQFNPPVNLGHGAPIIFGWDCFLLDVQDTKIEWEKGQKVLALTGGSDTSELGKTWPTLLDQVLSEGTELHWVTGPFAKSPYLPDLPHISIHNHEAPDGLGSLMKASNYAVTVFGVSFFELLYYGVPTVVFSPYNGKDNSQLDAIAEAEVALVAKNEIEAADMLVDLMNNEACSRNLSKKAHDLLNPQGVIRLCNEIDRLLNC